MLSLTQDNSFQNQSILLSLLKNVLRKTRLEEYTAYGKNLFQNLKTENCYWQNTSEMVD
jgi:hypothetical protein